MKKCTLFDDKVLQRFSGKSVILQSDYNSCMH